MIAKAPGKVVLSGAYAVLEGAPSLVAAVDRYVVADARRPPTFETPEVKAALGERRAPWFDASALRSGDRKLGLGSSAAIVVASLAAVHAEDGGATDDGAVRTAVLTRALEAHRRAQGGGSGIDVASSAWGGFIRAERRAHGLSARPVALPSLVAEVWACPDPASTAEFLRRVEALADAEPDRYRELLGTLVAASNHAADAADRGDAPGLLQALGVQRDGLDLLGKAASIAIFTDAVREASRIAAADGAIVMPAGAGGGDIATYFGRNTPSDRLLDAARSLGLARLDVRLGARGVHIEPEPQRMGA